MLERRIWSSSSGTATVEFIGLIPALILVALIACQFLVAGFSLWSASTAARAGARAVQVGTDPGRAARRALPGPIREDSRVSRDRGGAITTEVTVPRLIPFLPAIRVEARSGLEAG